MTTPNTLPATGGVSDAEVEAALQGMRFTATGIPKHEDMRRALESFAQSRHASAQGGDIRAWESEDGRVISAAQKATALRDGGASASSVKGYTTPLFATPPNAPQDSLVGDAERYQWLRKSHPDDEVGIFVSKERLNGWGRTVAKILRNSELDKAIDAAIRAGRKTQP